MANLKGWFSPKLKKKRETREKRYIFRNFIKELKRVKWNADKDLLKSFLITLIFIIITSLIFVFIASFSQTIFRILRFI